MMGFDDELQDAVNYGYEEIILKPVRNEEFYHWFGKGIVKRPSWKHKHQRLLINYVLNDLKILQNDVELTDKIIDHCWIVLLERKFEREYIKNKLLMLFFKYISCHTFICSLSFLMLNCPKYTVTMS